MHGDHPVHSAMCRPGHPVTADCPVDCLAPLLSSRVLHRLARAEGRHGEERLGGGQPGARDGVKR